MTSSASSPSSSDSALPQSRASTPSSEVSVHSRLPDTYVYLTSTSSLQKCVFDKHASGGYLGVIINDDRSHFDFIVTQQKGTWTQCNDYFTSTTYSPPEYTSCAPKPSTDPTQAQHLLAISRSSLRTLYTLPIASGKCTLHVLECPGVVFPPLSLASSFSPGTNIPTPDEWRTLWSAWDMVTLQMIPQEMLHQKPIDLRHKCLFYIGHIPTFLDMLLSKAIGGSPTEPKYFWSIFERGIDPHVDDPNHCHNHSEVPEKDEDWPTIDSIIMFRNSVRERLMRLYADLQTGKRTLTRNIARTLVMTIEHEGWHIETLLYMLIQRAGSGTLPPPGFSIPPWEILSHQWRSASPPSTPCVALGPSTLTLGHDDSEAADKLPEHAEDVDGRTYGWDNESPARVVEVGAFRAEWRPVTNGEFLAFYRAAGENKVGLPKSWVEEDGEFKVRTMFGPVSMDIAEHWPVLASYDDLVLYAQSKGGRLPTEPELRLFLDMYDVGHEGGANVGFRNWHPVPATAGLQEHEGKGSNGGVWEWTSTLFDTHDGIAPTQLFTGYSTDFFDTKHRIVLGASYATIPRLAGRRTVRNFYQHNYPYPWVGARVVYDA